MQSHANIKFNY